jgi:hypothetical protein
MGCTAPFPDDHQNWGYLWGDETSFGFDHTFSFGDNTVQFTDVSINVATPDDSVGWEAWQNDLPLIQFYAAYFSADSDMTMVPIPEPSALALAILAGGLFYTTTSSRRSPTGSKT